MLSTPYNAYKYLLELGVREDVAKLLVSRGRELFEYFLEVIK